MVHTEWVTAKTRRQADVDEESPHETPHFNVEGGCDCFCDFCLKRENPNSMIKNYVCCCGDCNGKCSTPHE